MAAEPPRRVKHYLEKLKGASPDIFETLCPDPVLIVLGGIIKPGTEFETKIVAERDILQASNADYSFDPNARVFPVAKLESANPYTHIIIIGRTHNTDIQLQSSLVSKMHAFITWQEGPEGKTYKIADGKSRNGTWLGDSRLPPQKIHPLSSGDTIGFGGSLFVRFYLPKDFYIALTEMSSQ